MKTYSSPEEKLKIGDLVLGFGRVKDKLRIVLSKPVTHLDLTTEQVLELVRVLVRRGSDMAKVDSGLAELLEELEQYVVAGIDDLQSDPGR